MNSDESCLAQIQLRKMQMILTGKRNHSKKMAEAVTSPSNEGLCPPNIKVVHKFRVLLDSLSQRTASFSFAQKIIFEVCVHFSHLQAITGSNMLHLGLHLKAAQRLQLVKNKPVRAFLE